jgi:hypothetical protein
MQYKEHYVIRWKSSCRGIGQFGPFDLESEAQFTMNQIVKRHAHVRHIYAAFMVRVSEVDIESFSTTDHD